MSAQREQILHSTSNCRFLNQPLLYNWDRGRPAAMSAQREQILHSTSNCPFLNQPLLYSWGPRASRPQ
jgi:hypothetical protein